MGTINKTELQKIIKKELRENMEEIVGDAVVKVLRETFEQMNPQNKAKDTKKLLTIIEGLQKQLQSSQKAQRSAEARLNETLQTLNESLGIDAPQQNTTKKKKLNKTFNESFHYDDELYNERSETSEIQKEARAIMDARLRENFKQSGSNKFDELIMSARPPEMPGMISDMNVPGVDYDPDDDDDDNDNIMAEINEEVQYATTPRPANVHPVNQKPQPKQTPQSKKAAAKAQEDVFAKMIATAGNVAMNEGAGIYTGDDIGEVIEEESAFIKIQRTAAMNQGLNLEVENPGMMDEASAMNDGVYVRPSRDIYHSQK